MEPYLKSKAVTEPFVTTKPHPTKIPLIATGLLSAIGLAGHFLIGDGGNIISTAPGVAVFMGFGFFISGMFSLFNRSDKKNNKQILEQSAPLKELVAHLNLDDSQFEALRVHGNVSVRTADPNTKRIYNLSFDERDEAYITAADYTTQVTAISVSLPGQKAIESSKMVHEIESTEKHTVLPVKLFSN